MDQDGKYRCRMGALDFGQSIVNFHFLLAKQVYFSLVAIIGSDHQQTNQGNCTNFVLLFQRVDLSSFTVLGSFVGYEVVALTINSIVALYRWDLYFAQENCSDQCNCIDLVNSEISYLHSRLDFNLLGISIVANQMLNFCPQFIHFRL